MSDSKNNKNYYYCELCDYISDSYFQNVTHKSSSKHLIKCSKYKMDLKNDVKTIDEFYKILKEETGVAPKDDNETIDNTIELLSSFKIPIYKINEIRERNKEFEKYINSSK